MKLFDEGTEKKREYSRSSGLVTLLPPEPFMKQSDFKWKQGLTVVHNFSLLSDMNAFQHNYTQLAWINSVVGVYVNMPQI